MNNNGPTLRLDEKWLPLTVMTLAWPVVLQSAIVSIFALTTIKHRVRRVIKEAGIMGSKLGPHALRHSGASLVAQETGSALAVKALLQHDKIDTSMECIHDAEDVIQQRISPFRLIAEKMIGAMPEMKQLAMVSDNGSDLVEGEEVDVANDFLDEQFREISEDNVVHSRFKADDLRLLCRAFAGGKWQSIRV